MISSIWSYPGPPRAPVTASVSGSRSIRDEPGLPTASTASRTEKPVVIPGLGGDRRLISVVSTGRTAEDD
jgi:hypothetical protein